MSDSPDTETPDGDNHTPPQIEAVWIDRQAGSGALDTTDGWSQNKHADYEYANDGRSDTRTTFYWRDDDDTPNHLRNRDRLQRHRDPEDRRSWDELAKWNDGKGAPSRKQDNFEADVERWTQTFCNFLDLTDFQYRQVRHIIVEDIELGDYGWIPAEHIIIGTISLVIDAEDDADPDEWTPDDWIVYRDDFEELMDDTDMEQQTLWTVRKRVHEESSVFSDDDNA
jgi:hypothetical protein